MIRSAGAPPLRLGIVGCGAVTETGHLPAVAASGGVQLTVLVDKNFGRAQELARRLKVPRAAADYADIIGQADAAIVALPHYLHAPVAAELLSHGIHVLVEKPMALNLAECDSMLEAAQKGGATLAVGIIRRFMPAYRFAREAIAAGVLGEVVSFDIRDGFVYGWPVASDFFFRREMAGGGVLIDTGAYTMDLVHWWFGEARSVRYADDNRGGVEANCEVTMEMDSGVRGFAELSRTRDLRNSVIVEGRRGRLEMSLYTGTLSITLSNTGQRLTGQALEGDGAGSGPVALTDLFRAELEDWLGAIRENRPAIVSGHDGRKAVSLIEACYSHRSSLAHPWESPAPAERPGP